MTLSKHDLIEVLTAALSSFREEFDSEITASRILTLLAVSENPGIQQVDVERYVRGLSASAVSRNILDWSDVTTNRKPGPGFLEQRPDPEYRRRNIVYPTAKALHWLEQLSKTVNERLAKKRR